MLSTFDVLSEIYKDWNKMNEAEQSSLALTLGMKTQIDVLSATLTNFDSALNAVEASQQSSGSAMRENERYMESLGAKVNLLKAEFQELILGDGGLSNFIKLIIDAGTRILEFANSGVGQAIIKLTLFASTVSLLNKGIEAFKISRLASDISGFIAIVGEAEGVTKKFSTALTLLNANPVVLSLTALVGTIYAVTKAIDFFTESESEARERIENQNKEIENLTKEANSAKDEIEKLQKELDSVNSKIESINSLGGVDVAREEELESLKKQSAELQRQIDLMKAKEKIAQDEAARKALEVLEEKKKSKLEVGDAGYTGSEKDSIMGQAYSDPTVGVKITGQDYEILNAYVDKLKELKTQAENNTIAMENLTLSGKGNSEEYKELESENEKLKQAMGDYEQEAVKLSGTLNNNVNAIESSKDAMKNLSDEQKNSIDNSKDAIDNLNDYINATDDNTNATENQAEAQRQSALDVEEASKAFADAVSNVTSLDDAYGSLLNAVNEYNSTGYFSLDTLENLLSLGDEYLSLLQFENGQLSINEQGLYALANARIDEAETTAIQSAQADLLALAMGNAGNETINAGNSASSASVGFNKATQEIVNLGIEAVNSSNKLQTLFNTLSAGNATQGDYNAKAQEITKSLANQINAFENVRKNIGKSISTSKGATKSLNKNTGSHKKNTGARKKNADATKAQTQALKRQKEALEAEADALEKQINDYEIVINYVKDLLKEEQEAVEKQKDAELDAIQEKMDALEKEQDAFEENIKSQIEALENQRDEQEKYWDEQIDAIKNANKELEENIKLQQLQEALAKAKSQKVKVLKGGRFVYAEDEEAISKAEQELADYEQQLAVQRQIEELEKLKEQALGSLDKQIEELEKYRDETKKNYENQLKDLQEHYDKVEAEYNVRIKKYDAYLKQFEDMLNASAKRHAQILYNELVGEQGNWDARMKALSKFVNNYDKKKAQLDGIKNQINSITNQIRGLENQARSAQNNVGSIKNAIANDISAINKMKDSVQLKYIGYVTGRTGANLHRTNSFYSSQMAQEQAEKWIKYYGDPYWASQGPLQVSVSSHYAKGTYSTPEDQIALVADPVNPSNRELVIPPKINNGDGVLGSFKKGTGIIPHGQTLTENLVNLARWSQNGGLERIENNTNSTNSKVINIENINLPNVQDGNSFVEYLENNFMNDSIQFANIRG